MNKEKKIWYAVDISCEVAAAEAIEFALNDLECLGTEIDCLRKSRELPQLVTGFFDSLPTDEEINSAVEESLQIHGFTSNSVTNISNRIVEEIDWLAEWKKHWKPTLIGKFIIAPPWENVEEMDGMVIRIEPNMAFGTGTHDTTKLCLKAVGELYSSEQSFLDVGMGTGILAIAAAKLGGTSIVGYDTDSDSVKIAIENAAANGVSDQIEFIDGPVGEDAETFDFVCANLTIDVIVPILPLLLSKSRSVLVLSGILTEQESIITKELKESNVIDFVIERSGEWISVIVRRGS